MGRALGPISGALGQSCHTSMAAGALTPLCEPWISEAWPVL